MAGRRRRKPAGGCHIYAPREAGNHPVIVHIAPEADLGYWCGRAQGGQLSRVLARPR